MSELLVEILGVSISNTNLEDGLEKVAKWLNEEGSKHYIVTPNPEFLVKAQDDREFFEVLNGADLAIPDGVGLIWAAKILGRPFKERVTGVEFMLGLSEMACERGFTIGLIGGKKGVAVKTKECLLERYPKLRVVLASEEWGNGVQSAKLPAKSGAGAAQNREGEIIDILFVAFGAPKQERWIAENLDKIPVRVAMGVGGSFDYISGVVPRAPKLFRNLGLEWLFRLIVQPWRIGRQLALMKFVGLVLKERLFN